MGVVNKGNQKIYFDYLQDITSLGFNKVFYKILKSGIYEGFNIEIIDNTHVKISGGVCLIRDNINSVLVKIEASDDVILEVSQELCYIVLRFRWYNIADNYADYLAVKANPYISGDVLYWKRGEDILVGKILYNSDGEIIGVDYTHSDRIIEEKYSDNLKIACVEPNEKRVYVNAGYVSINNIIIKWNGGYVDISDCVDENKKKYAFLFLKVNGEIEVVYTQEYDLNSTLFTYPEFPQNSFYIGYVVKRGFETINGNDIFNYGYIQKSYEFRLDEYGYLSCLQNTFYVLYNIFYGTNSNFSFGLNYFDGNNIYDVFFNYNNGDILAITTGNSNLVFKYNIDNVSKIISVGVLCNTNCDLYIKPIKYNTSLNFDKIFTISSDSGFISFLQYSPQRYNDFTDKQYVDNNINSLKDYIENMFVGTICAFAMSTPPNGWLECNGQAVSRTTYARLFAKIGTTWGAGDGSTTFNVPDLRGEFLRGWDNGRGVDSGREFASWQNYSISNHRHNVRMNHIDDKNFLNSNPNQYPSGDGDNLAQYLQGELVNPSSTSATVTTETRPRNIAVLYCIKY